MNFDLDDLKRYGWFLSDTANCYYVIPKMFNDIVGIKEIVPNQVYEFTFGDGVKIKTTCHKSDEFNFERAVEVAVGKHFAKSAGAFNNTVKRGVKLWDKIQKDKIAAKAEEERIAKKRAKFKAYKERCKAKAEAQAREREIEIQTEAYLRAMQRYEASKKSN